ncbi:MAG: dihydrofolate reductase [Desulfurivibrionaceae bacterium]
MEIIIIAAMAANRAIGKDNRIPWHLADDLKHFKETTMGHPLVMGRKTFESIGQALPGRRTIILTRDKDYSGNGVTTASSLYEALQLCRGSHKVFIAGGGEIFREAMPIADKIILTTLNREVEGDVFFPEIPAELFIESEKKIMKNEEDDETYTIQVFQRKGFQDIGKN